MFTNRQRWVALAVIFTACVLAWLALVPGLVAGRTFAWAATALALGLAVAHRILGRAAPERSVSEMLYDVEHPADVRR